MAMIHIDGVAYEVEAGRNLLESCLSLGLDLPYFCWHPAMGSVGACRQCAVVQYQDADDDRGRIVMGCMTAVADGARFSLAGDRAGGFRRAVVETLMINHPHDCPVCSEGGECHLQDMTVMTGHRDRRYRGSKQTFRNQYLGPLVHHEMNRCITCYRCTRFYRDYAGGTDLAALASRDRVYFGRHEDGVLESEFAGNLVEVCPTGVFTDRTLLGDYTRKWDLQSAPSVCAGCAVGCNTFPGERYGRLKRVHNRFNSAVNGYFLCDRGRYGQGWVNGDARLDYPGLRGDDGRFDAIDRERALAVATERLAAGGVAGIGSPRASVESNYLLRELVGADNCAPGLACHEQPLVDRALALLRSGPARVPDLEAIEAADCVLVLGEDVTASAPRLALALRQSVRNAAFERAAGIGLQPWQDGAIRNLAQDLRSPLFIVAPGSTRLDDVASDCIHLAPAAIAAFGEALAASLRGAPVHDAPGRVAEVAAALAAARRPLVIAGTTLGEPRLLDAAHAVAAALAAPAFPPTDATRSSEDASQGANEGVDKAYKHAAAMLSLIVPEANSLGQALLHGPAAPDLVALRRRAEAGELSTLLVLENDLFRRGSRAEIEALLAAFREVIVLDCLDTPTASAAGLVLSTASQLESEGTLVSLEGRAQRHFPVYAPREARHPAWHWLLSLLQAQGEERWQALRHFDDVMAACAASAPALAGLAAAAPGRDYRSAGARVPRQPERYSGRTAMRAHISVHEPQQPQDAESPLAYSMEGFNNGESGALLPFVWAPGWNSNQALHKFQTESGGPLRGGPAGVRLLDGGAGELSEPVAAAIVSPSPSPSPSPAEAESDAGNGWQLVPQPVLFGSEPLSALSPGVCELVPAAFLSLAPSAAATLGVAAGDGVRVGDAGPGLEVRIDPALVSACAGYSLGLAGCEDLAPGTRVTLARAADWRRSDAGIIARSGDAHG
ncbi:MAG: NADH-quinone oxidoreductase subunit NuoG [Chromatocurvus sp.]